MVSHPSLDACCTFASCGHTIDMLWLLASRTVRCQLTTAAWLFGCAGTEQVTETPYYWGVHEDVYCAGKEEVFEFLEAVLKEVIAIFPCTYFHIGGDEVCLQLDHELPTTSHVLAAHLRWQMHGMTPGCGGKSAVPFDALLMPSRGVACSVRRCGGQSAGAASGASPRRAWPTSTSCSPGAQPPAGCVVCRSSNRLTVCACVTSSAQRWQDPDCRRTFLLPGSWGG